MPLGFLRDAGGWHLRSKPCVVLSLFFFNCVSRGILTSLQNVSPVCRYYVALGVLSGHKHTQKAYEEILFQ